MFSSAVVRCVSLLTTFFGCSSSCSCSVSPPARPLDHARAPSNGVTAVGASAAVEPTPLPSSSPAASASSDPSAEAEARRILPIRPRRQHPDSPPSGWCAETAIQEALLYFGVWAPQPFVHAAGKSRHPDLYSDEIPGALHTLGVNYDIYAPTGGGFAAYGHWVIKALDAGDPVLSGVKILPTVHPDWGLDHFVLSVGHGSKGLLVNTTWGDRRWVDETTTRGLSFKNAFYAIRITGVRLTHGARPARLTVLAEDGSHVQLRVQCPFDNVNASRRVERRADLLTREPSWWADLDGAAVRSVETAVQANLPARFQCVVGPRYLLPASLEAKSAMVLR